MNELTREQILAMPAGRDLNALVAQHVMGLDGWHLSGEFLKPYSLDIAAAWEVVEQMHKLNWWTVINYQEEEKNAFFYWDPHQKGIDVSAETIPLAICRASLLAVMGL